MELTLSQRNDIFSSNILSLAMVDALAADLGVSSESLLLLGIGFSPDSGAFTFPERDECGNVIGIVLRHPNGKKTMIPGSKRGLTFVLNPDYTGNERQYEPGRHNWVRVQRAGIACPICGKPDWCLVSAANPHDPPAVVCSRISEGSRTEIADSGYLHILKPEGEVNRKGMILPPSEHPVLVVEGHSDVAAAMDLGFVAVGRPSAKGKLELLKGVLKGRCVVVMGENDGGAGQEGMEATFSTLISCTKGIAKLLPPDQYKDLRMWKKEANLTLDEFLKWAQDNQDETDDPNIFESDIASIIGKRWLDEEKTINGVLTTRCYKGQWIDYQGGYYEQLDREEFRGSVYRFLEGKKFRAVNAKGLVDIQPYKATRAKVSDIIDSLSAYCNISKDPPRWLDETTSPSPNDIIVFNNGILDVSEYIKGNVVMRDHTPAYFNFHKLPYDFNEDAGSKLWEDYLRDVFDDEAEKIDLLAEWFGYNCIPDMSMEKLMLFHGRPRSGKGTVLSALVATLGHQVCTATSFQSLATQFGYQPLIGKLAVVLGDARVCIRKDAASALEKILQIVGRDPVCVERKFLTALPNVQLTCRFTIAMNDLPNIPDQANALEPRLNVITFANSYVGREDFSLKSRLTQVASEGGMINFALNGLRRLRQNKIFTIPPSSHTVYRQMKELMMPVSGFVADCCELAPPGDNAEYFAVADELYDAWVVWCKESGRQPGIKDQFGKWILTACPLVVARRMTIGLRRCKAYQGIRLAKWVTEKIFGR